jgi:hypothetical protein
VQPELAALPSEYDRMKNPQLETPVVERVEAAGQAPCEVG